MTTDRQTELQTIKTKIKTYMYDENTDILDLLFAVMISRKQTTTKLWIMIIGASGDGKTELLKMFESKNTITLRSLTGNTLINGRKDKTRYPDLAPELKNKVLLIPEMAQISNLHQDERNKIFSQLRDLYDGIAGKRSAEYIGDYTGLNVSMIACSTPVIDKYVLIGQSLGTRELLYRTEEKDAIKLMTRIRENCNKDEDEIRKELKKEVSEFIEKKEYQNKELEKRTEEEIKIIAKLVSKLRTPADLNYNTGELTNKLTPEMPTRILKQLIVLYNSLKSLEEEYKDEDALRILWKTALSSCQPNRLLVLKEIMKLNEKTSANKLCAETGLAKNTIKGELAALRELGLIREEAEIDELNDRVNRQYETNMEAEEIKLLMEKRFFQNPTGQDETFENKVYKDEKIEIIEEESI